MNKTRNFLKTTLLGGITVILPTVVLLLIFGWFFGQILNLVKPLTKLLQAEAGMQNILANAVALTVVIGSCFVIGLFVRTRIGGWIYNSIERKILSRVPTYSLVKETVAQFSGAKKFPFSSVALVRVYGNDVLTTGFVMSIHTSGYQTVFVPTGPNPTSGMIFYIPERDVFPVDIEVQETMRVIFNCGSGSGRLLDSFVKKYDEQNQNVMNATSVAASEGKPEKSSEPEEDIS